MGAPKLENYENPHLKVVHNKKNEEGGLEKKIDETPAADLKHIYSSNDFKSYQEDMDIIQGRSILQARALISAYEEHGILDGDKVDYERQNDPKLTRKLAESVIKNTLDSITGGEKLDRIYADTLFREMTGLTRQQFINQMVQAGSDYTFDAHLNFVNQQSDQRNREITSFYAQDIGMDTLRKVYGNIRDISEDERLRIGSQALRQAYTSQKQIKDIQSKYANTTKKAA